VPQPTTSEQELLTACGGKIKDPQKFPSAVFHGERVYFCTQACLNAFESDPERFMAGEIEHPED
jgi:YHS domain-containing protein